MASQALPAALHTPSSDAMSSEYFDMANPRFPVFD
jgi:hypothetical protein